MRALALPLLFGLIACGSPQHPNSQQEQLDTATAHYLIAFSPTLNEAQVRVCFEGRWPVALRRIDRHATERLRHPRIGTRSLAQTSTRIPLGDPPRDAGREMCVRYEVSLAPRVFGPGSGGWSLLHRDGELLVTVGLLLWLPSYDGEVSSETHVQVEVPEGLHVSTPWSSEVTDASLSQYAGNLVVTRAAPRRFDADGLTVEVARMEGDLRIDDDGIQRWLSSAIDAVQPVGGLFPRRKLHFVLVPLPSEGDGVAFGLVRRGGGASVLLFVHGEATEESLMRDWVTVHELSHLTMPKLENDRWISEGYATYMQEYLRMRAGLLSPEAVFAHMLRSFARERRGTGRPLQVESDTLGQHRRYAHVYWMGAAFFFELDVMLHRRGTSLAALMASPWRPGTRWVGRRCLAELDRRLGEALVEPLSRRYRELVEVPSFDELLRRLGVRFDGRTVTFDDAAPEAAIRQRMAAQPR